MKWEKNDYDYDGLAEGCKVCKMIHKSWPQNSRNVYAITELHVMEAHACWLKKVAWLADNIITSSWYSRFLSYPLLEFTKHVEAHQA